MIPRTSREWANKYLAVGLAEHMSVNATCVRSTEGFYAIVVHSGLITLFNKVSKLLAAMTDPASVVYCNREYSSELTREKLLEWYMEVTQHYRETRLPLGPQILLHGDPDGRHAFQLAYWERFIFCHELGHVFCGHLEKPENWTRDSEFGALERYEGSNSHKLEHEADVFGYLLLRHLFMSERKPNHIPSGEMDMVLLEPVTTLFDLMYLLGGTASASHPDSITRLLTLVNAIYGSTAAQLMASSYDDKTKLISLSNCELSPAIDAAAFAKQCLEERKAEMISKSEKK